MVVLGQSLLQPDSRALVQSGRRYAPANAASTTQAVDRVHSEHLTGGYTMPPNIAFGEKFYAYREPAWHTLGIVGNEARNALQVADMVGIPVVATMPLHLHGKAGNIQVAGYKAIVGSYPGSKPGGQEIGGHTVFTYGVVSNDYQLVTHTEAARIWDEATQQATIETMGLLGHGETMFITSKLPTMDVRGDEIDNYLLLCNPLDGRTAIRARTTSVRVVCQNTLSVALGFRTEREYRGIHKSTKNIATGLSEWLKEIWAAQTESINVLQQAYEALADRKIAPVEAVNVLNVVYPLPKAPEDDKEHDAFLVLWDKEKTHQRAVDQLYIESPHNTEATKGTAWGLYQAFVEYEDYVRPRTNAQSRVFGIGAARKQKAFDACMSLVG